MLVHDIVTGGTLVTYEEQMVASLRRLYPGLERLRALDPRPQSMRAFIPLRPLDEELSPVTVGKGCAMEALSRLFQSGIIGYMLYREAKGYQLLSNYAFCRLSKNAVAMGIAYGMLFQCLGCVDRRYWDSLSQHGTLYACYTPAGQWRELARRCVATYFVYSWSARLVIAIDRRCLLFIALPFLFQSGFRGYSWADKIVTYVPPLLFPIGRGHAS